MMRLNHEFSSACFIAVHLFSRPRIEIPIRIMTRSEIDKLVNWAVFRSDCAIPFDVKTLKSDDVLGFGGIYLLGIER